jgi:folate-binding protein YgfZ
LWLAPSGVTAPAGLALSAEQWQVGEVMSGIAWVEQATFEAFVPQMLNYESVGGVNFKKGCYPGQEVVARSQFRGTLKRRTFVALTRAPIQAGTEVMAGEDACGLVAQSAALSGGAGVALVCLLLSHAERNDLTADGQSVRLLPLPYPLLQDI